mmetsp:Transcript_54534/g.162932  ORF Transcript_54534/g.162932 Transcript_54534/m.162932 type:complete len:392 (-) Transcript_54534:81-1256(-)|eukprot:CAMPEP_0113559622 /NCGR_PEP_ID=MMETSP0015_2-20120614/18997_1 /TAXON_ID=2838 /ORGANISM="Odontella" /LENGTH=391 /DNA_ID=CAMNT_0000461275 /DNA_START=175 /DNA_END=1350 /DNA_ORIENTATION=- /assembly_acc=CAM_ASM_000160
MKISLSSSFLFLALHLPASGAFSGKNPAFTTSSTAPTSPSASTSSSPSSPSSDAMRFSSPSLAEFDYLQNDCLPWIEQGYGSWTWRGNNINYLEMGDPSKPALLLIHGFGASAYHWRYNAPVLARDYHVYAFDLLGFGLSDKPVQDYSAEVWRDQAVDFVREIIGKETTVAGNSLGGFTALYAASTGTAGSAAESEDAEKKKKTKEEEEEEESLIKGCVLLNGAGRFRDPDAPAEEGDEMKEKNAFIEWVSAGIQRAVIAASFVYTKQPARIEQVLKQVYPVDSGNVDPELVESIRVPSLDPNAAEVFYRVIAKNGSGPQAYVDDLLEDLDTPLLLAWGEEDPWIRPAAADRIQELYPVSRRVSIDAGHCPHDEAPGAVNSAILDFMKEVH